MVGWHHQLNGHESEQTPGDSEEQGSLSAAVHGVAVGHNLANEQQNVYGEVLFAFLQSWAIKSSVDHHLTNALVSLCI